MEEVVEHVHVHAEHIPAHREAEHCYESVHHAKHPEEKARVRPRYRRNRDSDNAGKYVDDIVHSVNLKETEEHSAPGDAWDKPQYTHGEHHNTEDPSQFLNHMSCFKRLVTSTSRIRTIAPRPQIPSTPLKERGE